MWIKTRENCYINMDRVSSIWYEPALDRTCCQMDKYNRYAICNGNHLEEIIRNIIDGINYMEVQ